MASSTSTAFDDVIDGSLFAFDSTTGQIIPQTSKVREAIEAALIDAFGTNLRVDAESPAGRLVEMWTMMVTRFCAVTALYANQLNPRYATGQMLDAIGSLFSIERDARTSSIIKCTFTRSGDATNNLTIPEGFLISDNSGHVFATNNNITIPAGSSFTDGIAVCTTPGPIVVANGTVTNIVEPLAGLGFVTNTGMYSVGADIESDFHFRQRVAKSRWTGVSFIEDITAEVERVGGVDSVYIVENSTNATGYLKQGETELVWVQPETGKWVAVDEHSVLIIVASSGASRDSIAEAIFKSKSAGCGMTLLPAEKGNPISIGYTDPITANTYPIKYNEPLFVRFAVSISVRKHNFIGTDDALRSAVKSAITAWARGEYPYVDGISLGQSVYSFEIGAAVSDAIPQIQITSVQVADITSNPQLPSWQSELSLFINEYAVIPDEATSITVTIS